MSEKTSKSILDELVVKAQTIGGIQGTMHNPRNATQVGQMVKLEHIELIITNSFGKLIMLIKEVLLL